MFCEKDVLRNFAKFTGKHLRQSFLFKEVAGLGPVTCFPVNFAKFLRTSFLQSTSGGCSCNGKNIEKLLLIQKLDFFTIPYYHFEFITHQLLLIKVKPIQKESL